MYNELSENFWKDYKKQVLDYEDCLKQIDLLNKEVEIIDKEVKLKEKNFYNTSWWICYFISFVLLFWLFNLNGNYFESIIASATVSLFTGSMLLIFSVFYTPGEIKKLREQVKINELKIQNLKGSRTQHLEKLQNLEELISTYCISLLESFYTQKLYQKRSHDQEFTKSLAQFSDMCLKVQKTSYTLITTNIIIDKYKKYIEKRSSIKAPEKDSFNPVSSTSTSPIITTIQSHIEPPKPLPPEHKYKKSGRINDWDLINKSRQETGLEGEQIVVMVEKYYLNSIGRQDLADKVRNIAREDGDGFGYDVLSFFENGTQKYIEVKSTKQNIYNPFYMSENELSFLKQNNSDAFIYRVLVDKESPRLRVYSSSDIFNSHDITPSQYKVKLKSF
jgi:hypothetical protein